MAEPDRLLLRRYHAAIARGDQAAALQAWEDLGVNNFDKIKQSVKAFRFSAASGGIPQFDQGSAVSEAWIRLQAMGAAFRKQEVEAYYAALVQCVKNTCLDFGRADLRHQKHSRGSLDERFDPESEAGPWDRAMAAWEAERRETARERIEEELDQQHAEGLVAWAIGQINNDNHREVLGLTFIEKLEVKEIAKRLGISEANVYQRRHRGLRELEKILREHGA